MTSPRSLKCHRSVVIKGWPHPKEHSVVQVPKISAGSISFLSKTYVGTRSLHLHLGSQNIRNFLNISVFTRLSGTTYIRFDIYVLWIRSTISISLLLRPLAIIKYCQERYCRKSNAHSFAFCIAVMVVQKDKSDRNIGFSITL